VVIGVIITCFEVRRDHWHVRPITGNQEVMIQPLEVEADATFSCVIS
jgi:hypothetical protein